MSPALRLAAGPALALLLTAGCAAESAPNTRDQAVPTSPPQWPARQ
jgi:hypothetical protein